MSKGGPTSKVSQNIPLHIQDLECLHLQEKPVPDHSVACFVDTFRGAMWLPFDLFTIQRNYKRHTQLHQDILCPVCSGNCFSESLAGPLETWQNGVIQRELESYIHGAVMQHLLRFSEPDRLKFKIKSE